MTDSPHPRCSVAMATYNGARHLQAQLDSIAAQTVLPAELVVSDDGSSDATLDIVRRFATTAPFPVVVLERQGANLGILRNFMRAFSVCQGEVIAYCDQDDVWDDRKLELCLGRLREPTTSLVMHCSLVVDADLRPTGSTIPPRDDVQVHRFPTFPIVFNGYGHQMVFRREVAQAMAWAVEHKLDQMALASNLDGLISAVAGLHGDVVCLPDPLIRFRRHATATSPVARQAEKTGIRSRSSAKLKNLLLVADLLRSVRLCVADYAAQQPTLQARWQAYSAWSVATEAFMRSRAGLYQPPSMARRLSRLVMRTPRLALLPQGYRAYGAKEWLHDAAGSVLGADTARELGDGSAT